MRKVLRRSLQKSGLMVGVSALSLAGAYTGVRRKCEAKEVVCEFFGEMAEDAPTKRSMRIYYALGAVFTASHALGHMARDGWDMRDLSDVMGDFNSVMKTTAAKVL